MPKASIYDSWDWMPEDEKRQRAEEDERARELDSLISWQNRCYRYSIGADPKAIWIIPPSNVVPASLLPKTPGFEPGAGDYVVLHAGPNRLAAMRQLGALVQAMKTPVPGLH